MEHNDPRTTAPAGGFAGLGTDFFHGAPEMFFHKAKKKFS